MARKLFLVPGEFTTPTTTLANIKIASSHQRLSLMAKRVALDLSHLLPRDDFLAAFTTCEVMDDPRIEKVFLDDNHLGVHKISSGTTHRVVHPPKADNGEDIKTAWEAFYPKGSVNPKGEIPGGFGLYVSGPPSFAERLATASEATFGYRMMLQKDWEWVKGGKLPGICTSRDILGLILMLILHLF